MARLQQRRPCTPAIQTAYPIDVFETFPQVRLDGSGIPSLRQDLQQLVVRQEVESREGVAFCLQVFTKPFLNLF